MAAEVEAVEQLFTLEKLLSQKLVEVGVEQVVCGAGTKQDQKVILYRVVEVAVAVPERAVAVDQQYYTQAIAVRQNPVPPVEIQVQKDFVDLHQMMKLATSAGMVAEEMRAVVAEAEGHIWTIRLLREKHAHIQVHPQRQMAQAVVEEDMYQILSQATAMSMAEAVVEAKAVKAEPVALMELAANYLLQYLAILQIAAEEISV